MALCMILLSIVLSTSLLNFEMKMHARQSNANFYDAESALEMIRMGLVADASDAAAKGYVATLESYEKLTVEERNEYFESIYAKNLIKALSDANQSYYKLGYIESLLGDTAKSYNIDFGAELTTTDGINFLNVTDDGVVLKNIRVRYTDEDKYINEIQTDIVLGYPVMNFELGGKTPDLAKYAFVANECVEVLSDTSVSGNAYLGKNDVSEDKTSEISAGVKMDFNSDVNIKEGEIHPRVNCDVIAEGFINVDGSLSFKENDLWLHDLQIDSGKLTIENSKCVFSDDLILAATKAVDEEDKSKRVGATAKISGEYYGVGHGNTADDSSAIVVNGLKTSLDMTGLEKMMIGGVSYVNTADYNLDNTRDDIMMGESIVIKPNQRAYLVPPDMIAPGTINGGVNPMLSTQYVKLEDELKQKYGEDDYKNHLVDFATADATIFEGVTGYKTVSYPIVNNNKTITMTYFFMVFDSAETASKYYDRYSSSEINKQRLTNNIKLYSKTDNSIRLPADIETADNMDFYYNGTILKSDESKLLLPRRPLTTEALDTMDKLQQQQKALSKKLIKDYASLSELERSQDVYDNLVKPMNTGFTDNKYVITEGNYKRFISTSGEGAAIVVNGGGTFVLSDEKIASASAFLDKDGNAHPGAKLSVVIADTDVLVTATSFEGMIISSGKITFQNIGTKTTIESNPALVLKALSAEDADGVMAVDYLRNSESYLLGGVASDKDTGSKRALSVSDLVYYANWSKR